MRWRSHEQSSGLFVHTCLLYTSTLHLPVTPDTKGLLNDQTFSQMKPGARLLNFARGDLVDEAALKSALDAGRVAAYVTDFPTAGLLADDRCVCLPHLGASTPESEDNCAVMAARELSDYLRNGNIANSVNFPAVSMPRSAGARICVIHKNVPGLLAAITDAAGAAKLNIENLTNKSRGAYAYTMLDTSCLLYTSGAFLFRAQRHPLQTLHFRFAVPRLIRQGRPLPHGPHNVICRYASKLHSN